MHSMHYVAYYHLVLLLNPFLKKSKLMLLKKQLMLLVVHSSHWQWKVKSNIIALWDPVFYAVCFDCILWYVCQKVEYNPVIPCTQKSYLLYTENILQKHTDGSRLLLRHTTYCKMQSDEYDVVRCSMYCILCILCVFNWVKTS